MDIQDGRYFCKIVYVIADPQMYRTFESIKNCQRCDFLKIFVIPGGNATPHKIQRGDTSAPLPNRSGRYQGTTPTTWLNFNTPCKSQLKNAWPFSPTRAGPSRDDKVSLLVDCVCMYNYFVNTSGMYTAESVQPCMHACMHACIRTCVHACIHTYIHIMM